MVTDKCTGRLSYRTATKKYNYLFPLHAKRARVRVRVRVAVRFGSPYKVILQIKVPNSCDVVRETE